ncbi:glucuronyl hydrolase [Sporothrix schenckii 1099-18]|uniref:Glucuronyl hydrolase n=1 Tax=Sporothrix schenckii 1099-18 TaxID=1397361 RepID=A0A0F2M6I9_SPOSC|nr:glucuronyl hydrolase [Sporothrix schenckii 1099-18]KJR83801.1 glucuronyl hydrolase [Sporothrix schenckii 1099-18]
MASSAPIVATATASSSSSASGILTTPLSTAASSPPLATTPLPASIQADFKIPKGASPETANAVLPSPPFSTSISSLSSEFLAGLYTENVAAKIWRVAESYLAAEPTLSTYPEYIPSSGENTGHYQPKPAAFWTCGFFPASLYCILERVIKYGVPGGSTNNIPTDQFVSQLLALGRRWTAPLHAQTTRTNTHDLGFIVRALRMDWELTGDPASLRGYATAAASLATRYSPLVGAIRSWDRAVSKRYEIADPDRNFLVIVDSMCNMDLLFYAARHANNPQLAALATQHARTVLWTLVRPEDGSTWHVANLDPALAGGVVQYRMTHQGYADGSTWSRGQAWAVLGFAQTYGWTALPEFLAATRRVADCFLQRLDASPAASHTYVPLWDFDAPVADADQQDSNGQPLRDTSAGMIAANGLLLLHQALERDGAERERKDAKGAHREYDGRYLVAALRIAHDTLGYSLDREDVAAFTVDSATGTIYVPAGSWDAILRHSTANNNRYALVRYADTGLVYADYYFLEFGNQLLRMGLQVAPR